MITEGGIQNRISRLQPWAQKYQAAIMDNVGLNKDKQLTQKYALFWRRVLIIKGENGALQVCEQYEGSVS